MRFELFNESCLDIMADSARVPDGSIDMVFADLPYKMTECAWDQQIIPWEPFWAGVWRVLRPNGAVVLTANMRFAVSAINSCPRWFRYDMVWDKRSRPTGFANANRLPLKAHENVLVFYRKLPYYDPQFVQGAQKGRKPDQRGEKRDNTSQGKGWKGLSPDAYQRIVDGIMVERYTDDQENVPSGKKRKQASPTQMRKNATPTQANARGGRAPHPNSVKAAMEGLRYPTTVQAFKRETTKSHPTEKPVALAEWFIRTFCPPGGTVLDPTMGSGSSGEAAARCGRSFVGCEIDPGYFAGARARVEAAYARVPDARVPDASAYDKKSNALF